MGNYWRKRRGHGKETTPAQEKKPQYQLPPLDKMVQAKILYRESDHHMAVSIRIEALGKVSYHYIPLPNRWPHYPKPIKMQALPPPVPPPVLPPFQPPLLPVWLPGAHVAMPSPAVPALPPPPLQQAARSPPHRRDQPQRSTGR